MGPLKLNHAAHVRHPCLVTICKNMGTCTDSVTQFIRIAVVVQQFAMLLNLNHKGSDYALVGQLFYWGGGGLLDFVKGILTPTVQSAML